MIAKHNTRVAAIIPVYAAGFLEEALESVLAQRRPADEVIVVNDGSPERAVIEAAVSRCGDRVTLLHQSNGGAASARNAGVMATDAARVAFLDADDRWHPDFLLRQMAFLDAHRTVDLVWADATIISDAPAVGRTFMSMCPSNGPVTLDTLLAQTCNVLTSTVVVRRQLVVEGGLFDVALRRGQDFDLWLRLVARGANAVYRREILAVRRLHGDNRSGTRLNELEQAIHVFDKALTHLPLTHRQRQIARQRVRTLNGALAREHGKARLVAGDFAAAREFLDRAHRAAPDWKLVAARVGLRFAPALIRRLYLLRGNPDIVAASAAL